MLAVLNTLRRYKPLPGMVAWIIQRLTGLGLAVFLLAHIFSIHRLVSGPAAFQEELKLYGNPFFKLSEIGLGLLIFSHAFNGLRNQLVKERPSFPTRYYAGLDPADPLSLPTAKLTMRTMRWGAARIIETPG